MIRLSRPGHTLRWLDEYEDCAGVKECDADNEIAEDQLTSLYMRVEVEVELLLARLKDNAPEGQGQFSMGGESKYFEIYKKKAK